MSPLEMQGQPSPDVPKGRIPTLNALRTRAAAQTHVGKVRQKNEDQFFIGEVTSAIQVRESTVVPPQLYLGSSPLVLLIVADGMGGHAAGERAAALAVRSVESFVLRAFEHIGSLGLQGPADLLLASFQIADGTVMQASKGRDSLKGMGTTMTIALVGGSEAHIAHAGDSRAYLFRNNALTRLTRDHTVAEAMRERGVPDSPGQDLQKTMSHIVTNAVGGGTAGVTPDIARLDLESGDQLLMCTDGLTNMVQDDTIAATLVAPGDPSDKANRLVEAALAGGGKDNITALVAHFVAE